MNGTTTVMASRLLAGVADVDVCGDLSLGLGVGASQRDQHGEGEQLASGMSTPLRARSSPKQLADRNCFAGGSSSGDAPDPSCAQGSPAHAGGLARPRRYARRLSRSVKDGTNSLSASRRAVSAMRAISSSPAWARQSSSRWDRAPSGARSGGLRGGHASMVRRDSEPIADAEPTVCLPGSRRGGAGGVVVKHGPGAPAGQLHQISFVAPGRQIGVGEAGGRGCGGVRTGRSADR